jgi:hypothetical protein
MLVNGVMSLISGIVLIYSVSQIRYVMPKPLSKSDAILIKLCWLVVARLMIVALYHIPVALDLLNTNQYFFQYLFKAYTYADLLTSIVGLMFSYYLYTKYYKNERAN